MSVAGLTKAGWTEQAGAAGGAASARSEEGLPPDPSREGKECPSAEAAASCPPCEGPAEPNAAAPAAQAAGAGGGGSAGLSWRDSPFAVDTGYKPGLTAVQLQKGLVSLGAASRARRALAKLLRGEPLSMAFVGGSITWGQGASEISKTDYAARVSDWVRTTFPKANHTLLNCGVPGVPSSYFALCSSWHVPSDVDLVVVESNVNDGAVPGSAIRHAHERLLRKLLRYQNRPAVLELVFYRFPGPNWTDGNTCSYRYHGDDEIGVLAQYYHAAWLGTRSLVWDYLQETAIDPSTRDGGMRQMWDHAGEDMDVDHPSDVGHGWLADMIIFYMQQVLDDVARRPPDAADEADAAAPLNAPMYLNNWESVNNTCLMGDLLKQQVSKADPAFQWVNEGTDKKPKWGFVSTEPGSSIWATINTNVTHRMQASENVSLAVAFLKSYEHMGMFDAACEKGCTCERIERDGHSQEQVSQMHLAHLLVSVSEACTLRLSVLNQTSSGEHKFKLLGLVVSEAAGVMLDESVDDQPMSVRYMESMESGWGGEQQAAQWRPGGEAAD